MSQSDCFSKIDLQLRPMRPFLHFWTGHSQTLLGHLVSSEKIQFKLNHDICYLKDGDTLDLFWHQNEKSDFTVLVFHGLGGDINADYMQRTAILSHQLKWNTVLINHRGVNGKYKNKRSYHSGRGEDLAEVIAWAKAKFNNKIIAVGFSMSASMLLNLLSSPNSLVQPDFGIAVNAPINLSKSAKLLSKGFSRVYDLRFFYKLKKMIQSRYSSTYPNIKIPLIGKTLDIDSLFTAPVNGFDDREDYYKKSSAFEKVSDITTKTFVLSAKDDPFIDYSDYIKANWSKSVHLTISDYGGHMGYFCKKTDLIPNSRWLDYYLRSVFLRIKII